MNFDSTLFSYFINAGIVVKGVMVILMAISIFSWSYILQRSFYLRDVKKSSRHFEKDFWSGEDLNKIYNEKPNAQGLEEVFSAGYKEFVRFRKQSVVATNTVMENTTRAMNVAKMRVQDKLENHLSFLAIVGSTSPYIGLFGTVWGIMQSFNALANVQQASIAMVAPGIAEALIATALGLFAAIPAVIAYNRFVTDIAKMMNRFDAFQEEFTNILIRQSEVKTGV